MASLFENKIKKPLAEALRPQSLDQVIGQNHLLGKGGALVGFLENKSLPSLIFWGPPGTGKTTIARLLAKHVDAEFVSLSAVFSGVADLKKVFEGARSFYRMGRKTLLFVDEIHRFNRAQQDALLMDMESGTIILVGATTENPSFELNPALLSRAQVLVLNALSAEALETLLQHAESYLKKKLLLTEDARHTLIHMADGDGRYLLNMVDVLNDVTIVEPLSTEKLTSLIQRRMPLYDKHQEAHYNLISALHKSLRGSDTDASLYWFARMLEGGEDPKYIARRLIRFATEDIGLADPQALPQALDAFKAYTILGSPEGELALAQLVIYLATAPKSNSAYMAYKAARKLAQKTGSVAPPKHILNAPTKLMKDLGYGKGYQYDHDMPKGFSGQNYFPEKMKRETLYTPNEQGYEREVKKRLEYWKSLREK